jgi:Ca2+-binding RTX toxin-like protein
MRTTTHRPLRIGALVALSVAFAAALLTPQAPAQANHNPECNGFTEQDAIDLGYVTFHGTSGADNFAYVGADWVWAWLGDGNDTITTDAGSDMICGRPGNDTIDTGDGLDVVIAGEGNDTVALGDGPFDFAEGGDGLDVISGGAGPDAIYGDDQSTFTTAAGHDVIDGGVGDDDLYGGPLGDMLLGDDGVDDLFGDDGLDVLTGGPDLDTGDGGSGNDVCIVETPTSC